MAGINENINNQPEYANEQPQVPANLAAQHQDVNMQDHIPLQVPQPHVHHTHKDNIISSLLSKLSLHEKLSKNKEIEDENKNRELKNYNHHMDLVAHLEAGSETASFIMIDEVDLKDLKDPSILARFTNFIPDFLLLCITRELWAEKEECEKRKLDKLILPQSESSLEAKQCCMDGSKVAERVIGSQHDIKFSDILFTTNAQVPIPLIFFRNANLCCIIDQATTLPTTKSNPLVGRDEGSIHS